YGKFPFPRHHEISSTILITKRMTTDNDWPIPRRDKPGYIFYYDRLAKNSSIQNVPDSSVGTLPHLLQVKFLHSCLIRRDSGTFDPNPILFDSIRRINRYLVVCLVTVFN